MYVMLRCKGGQAHRGDWLVWLPVDDTSLQGFSKYSLVGWVGRRVNSQDRFAVQQCIRCGSIYPGFWAVPTPALAFLKPCPPHADNNPLRAAHSFIQRWSAFLNYYLQLVLRPALPVGSTRRHSCLRSPKAPVQTFPNVPSQRATWPQIGAKNPVLLGPSPLVMVF